MHTARLVLTGPRRQLIRRVLEQEMAPRAGIYMDEVGQELHITISADSAAHLRAACNSFLHWIDLVERIGDTLSGSCHSSAQ